MRALLSAVGTRGDVQPVLALALQLRALGHDARLCVPPNLLSFVEAAGFEARAMGVAMRQVAVSKEPVTPEQLARMRATMPDLIGDQFDAIEAAITGCDVVLGGNAHQYAARALAEQRGLAYVTALYAPVAIPSPEHAPPPAPSAAWCTSDADTNLRAWEYNRRAWNERALERVNHHRTRRGLAAVEDVLSQNLTDRPWLASDAALGPVPSTPGRTVWQTGAWVYDDPEPLSETLESFLDAGEPPICVGFGSMPVAEELADQLVTAALALGHRVISAQGWSGHAPRAANGRHLVIEQANHRRLFARVAAVVHHGGAGTTAAAARAGVPQLVLPLFGDQFYWGERVRALDVGDVLSSGQRSADDVHNALERVLHPTLVTRAHALSSVLDDNGALAAARALVALT